MSEPGNRGARFLLIHGSRHGAWCWEALIPALAALGHEARAIDLPGHGDGRDPAGVTLADYGAAIVEAAGAMDGPVTLVGHSAAGFPLTLAADRAPGLFAGLIYLCAYVPAPGMSMIAMRRAGPRQTLSGALQADRATASYRFRTDTAADLLYHDCPREIAERAVTRLCAEPIAPQDTPLWPGAGYASLPKHYVLCEQDRVIPPDYQASMAAAMPVSRLAASHSPFLAMPTTLAETLVRIAA